MQWYSQDYNVSPLLRKGQNTSQQSSHWVLEASGSDLGSVRGAEGLVLVIIPGHGPWTALSFSSSGSASSQPS